MLEWLCPSLAEIMRRTQLRYCFESSPFVHLFPVPQTNLSEKLIPHYSLREPTKPSVPAPSQSFVFSYLFRLLFVLLNVCTKSFKSFA